VSQVRGDRSRRNETHSTDGDGGVLAQAAGAARVAQDGYESVHDRSHERLELRGCNQSKAR
jgi:hypothetical protein